MKATTSPISDHAAHCAAQTGQHRSAESEVFRSASHCGPIADDAIPLQAIAGELGTLFGSESQSGGLGVLQRTFARLDSREQPLVQLVMRSSRHPAVDAFRRTFNWLGNGWIYGAAAVAVLATQGQRGVRPVMASACAALIAILFYTSVKPLLGRLRPRDADPLLRVAIEPQDKYSCPSGHSMSAVAIAVPLLISFPHVQFAVLSVVALIAWSRIACGHHYPSDVLLGIGLGIAISLPICNLIL